MVMNSRNRWRRTKENKRKSREKDKDEDIHFLQESFNYQPFGRGGGGAPLRDQFGNMITSRKPFMRGDHERMHFKKFMKRSGSRSSHGESRGGQRSHHQKDPNQPRRHRYNDHGHQSDSDDYNEPDVIAQGPISNTTAETAAQMASNEFFRPDYIVEYQPKKKKKPGPMPKMQPEAPPPQPQINYQIIQPQVDWTAW